METLILKNSTDKKLKALIAYAKKIGLEVMRKDVNEDKVDENLVKIMKEEKTGKHTSRDTIFKNLNK